MAGAKRCRCSPSLVELRRRHVRGRHQRHAAAQEAGEQAAEDHGIGDVGDEELIEAQHARRAGDVGREPLERGALRRQLLQARVHLVHEAVEVQPAAFAQRQAVEEQVHEPGLAAPDATPEVQAAHRRAAAGGQQRGEPARPGGGGRDEAAAQRIEVRHRRKLRALGAEAALAQLRRVTASQFSPGGRARVRYFGAHGGRPSSAARAGCGNARARRGWRARPGS